MTNLKYLDLSECSNTILPGKWDNVSYAFKGSFETIIFPKNTIEIPQNCFHGCENLKGQLILPDGLKTIGEYAFYGCVNLEGDLIIPDNVTYIGRSAFNRCTSLAENLVLGESVESIRQHAFDTRFKSIIVKADTPPTIYYKKDSSNGTLIDTSFGTITWYSKIPCCIYVNYSKRSAYLNSDWNIFSHIEETAIDKLGY